MHWGNISFRALSVIPLAVDILGQATGNRLIYGPGGITETVISPMHGGQRGSALSVPCGEIGVLLPTYGWVYNAFNSFNQGASLP